MTTTFSLPIAATGEDKPLALTCIHRAGFGPGIPVSTKNGGEETKYLYATGSPSYPTSLRVGHYPPNGGGVTTNDSVKIRTTGKKVDGDGVETGYPVEATIAVADGSLGQLPRAEIAALIMMALSVYMEGVGVDDEASTTAITRLSFGVTDILNVTMA